MKLPNLRDLLSASGRISSDHHYSWTRASLKNEEAILCSEGDKRLQGIGFLFVDGISRSSNPLAGFGERRSLHWQRSNEQIDIAAAKDLNYKIGAEERFMGDRQQ
jgi:hypothetical protein